MSATLPTLRRRGSELASAGRQRAILEAEDGLPRFEERLGGAAPVSARSLDVFQINVGKLCNQTRRHCHVDAGPDRTEIMTQETAEQCIAALERSGAPR